MSLITTGVNGRSLILPGRNGKPTHYSPFGFRNAKDNVPPEQCKFCPGNEHHTPSEVARIEKNGEWAARIIPSAYPIIVSIPERQVMQHHIIIPAAQHMFSFSTLPLENHLYHLQLLARSGRDIGAHPHVSYVAQFTNEGYWSGASMEHLHSQSVGMPFLPKSVKDTARECSPPNCVFCKAPNGRRLVYVENEHFVALCPEDSQFYYQTSIIGKKHIPSLGAFSDSLLQSLGDIFSLVMRALDKVTDSGSHNVLYSSAPIGSRNFHFHMDILPRISQQGGFELISEIAMLYSSPRDWAQELSAAIKSLQ